MRKNSIIILLTTFITFFISGMVIMAQGNKEVLFVVAPYDFREEEYFIPKKIIENAGFTVITASTVKGSIKGITGGEAISQFKLNQVKAGDYAGIVFVGGPGAKVLWDNNDAHKIAIEANKAHKPIGAICIAPVILARTGILKNIKATVFPGVYEELEKSGAKYIDTDVIKDKNIVTASGPPEAKKFGETMVQLLKTK